MAIVKNVSKTDKVKSALSFVRRPRFWTTCLLLAFIIGSLSWMYFSDRSGEIKDAQQKVYALTGDINDLKRKSSDDSVVIAPSEIVSSAKSAGDDVSVIQNDLSVTDPFKYQDKVVKLGNKMKAHLDAKSADGMPWYRPNDGTKSEWTFRSSFSFTAQSVDVVWTCRDVFGGDLLAYSTGTYDAVTKKFSNVKTETTYAGAKHITSAGDRPAPNGVR